MNITWIKILLHISSIYAELNSDILLFIIY